MARYIDADKLKHNIKHRCVLSPLDAPWPLAYGNTDIFDIIDAQPTIEAESIKHGRWLKNGDRYCECSVCHHEGNISGQDNYCWCCGAKMDEVEE